MSAPAERRQLPIGVVNTLATAGGCALGVLPIGALFTDDRWFMEALGAIILVTAPAALLRLRSVPRSVQLLPGLGLLVVYTYLLYVHHGALGGVIPWRGNIEHLQDLQRQTRDIITNGSTPLRSTAGIRLYVIPCVGLLAALTDWLANVRRSPALAGIGFLASFTVVGAIRGTSVHWWLFVMAAIGYLIVLVTASRRETAEWGRVVPRVGQSRDSPLQLSASGARIGAMAVILAVVLPSVIPGLNRNVLLDAFRSGVGGGGGSSSVSAFAGLAGQLRQKGTTKWLSVHVSGTSDDPFYLRQKVLTEYSAGGWREGTAGQLRPPDPDVLRTGLDIAPTENYQATIKVLGLRDTAPIFGQPTSLQQLRSDWLYDTDKRVLSQATTRAHETYSESVAEPQPTIQALRAAGPSGDAPTGVSNVPAQVRTIVQNTVKGKSSPYDKAIALLNFFSPQNGFSYSLTTQSGDSGSALLDFLTNRVGFCQQYAAAMAIMLRVAGINSRVVIGFTHNAPDSSGNLTITNHDAHAWVEADFQGIGWVPFDPTPLAGADAGRVVGLPWAPHSTAPASSAETSREVSASNRNQGQSGSASSSTPAGAGGRSSGGIPLPSTSLLVAVAVVAVIVALLGVRPAVRSRQRRTRFRRAETDSRFGPIWQELQATVIDARVPWPLRTTPRQVPAWLGKQGVRDRDGVGRLAVATEREFYDVSGAGGADAARLSDAMSAVRTSRAELAQRMSRRRRIWMRLWPASATRRGREGRSLLRRKH